MRLIFIYGKVKKNKGRILEVWGRRRKFTNLFSVVVRNQKVF